MIPLGLDYDNVIRDPNFQFNFFSRTYTVGSATDTLVLRDTATDVMNPFYRRVLTFPSELSRDYVPQQVVIETAGRSSYCRCHQWVLLCSGHDTLPML